MEIVSTATTLSPSFTEIVSSFLSIVAVKEILDVVSLV